MFKLVRRSEIDYYKNRILELKIKLLQAEIDASLSKDTSAADAKLANDLKEELRVERLRRELAEASVKALEDHLRVLESIKK